jgi:predicted MFS family arabinose efflux permease
LYFLTAAVGGVAWSVVGGVLGNYLLDRIPEGDQPGHLAWYNLILNAAVLLGSLGGPLLADLVGLRIALMIIAGGRLFSAILIWWINREARFTPVR